MTIDEMIEDFCRRSETRYTPERVREIMRDYISYATSDGFLVIGIVHDECHIILVYVRPGAKDVHLFAVAVEDIARQNNCRVIRFLSRRSARALQRSFPDYKPVATMYEKELSN
jgi:hypothetical protein